ncbi:hypothetical protein HMI56_005934 [Coelomomyces lativittatus]|nr:hypothetical protein HMI56_005934 [Coelomomyces lativittatus]
MFSNLNSSSETYRSRDFSIHTPRPKPSSVKRPSLFEELKWELQKRPPPTPHSQHKDPRLISSSPPASSSRNHASMTFQETIPSWVFEYCGVPSPLEIPSSTMTINPQCKETSNSLAPSSESSKRPLQMHTSQQSEGPSFEVSNEVESKSVSEKSKKSTHSKY